MYERIRMNVERHLLVLVGGDCDELGLTEEERVEATVGQLEDVVGANQVEARLVLVHRVQNRLFSKTNATNIQTARSAVGVCIEWIWPSICILTFSRGVVSKIFIVECVNCLLWQQKWCAQARSITQR